MRIGWIAVGAAAGLGTACGDGDGLGLDINGLTPAGGSAATPVASSSSGPTVTPLPRGSGSTPAAPANGGTGGSSDADGPGDPPLTECDAPAPRALLTGANVFSLSADDAFVYFVDADAGPSGASGPSGAVKRVAIDSGEVTTLFEPAAAQRIGQMRRAGSDLYLLMADTTPDDNGGFVFRLPVTGGTPTLVGPQGTEGYSLDLAGLAAIGASSVYMIGSDTNRLYEIALADGAERIVAEVDGISRPQLLGDTLWYAAADGAGDIFRLDTSVAGAVPELAIAGGCGGGSIVNGSTYLVTDTGVLCGGLLSVGKLPLTGGEKESFWAPPLESAGGEISPARLDGDSVFIVGGRFTAQVSVDGGSARFVACEGMTLDALMTNASSILWGRGGFGVGLPTNQVLGPTRFTEIAVTPR
jgi:hypothetical protein